MGGRRNVVALADRRPQDDPMELIREIAGSGLELRSAVVVYQTATGDLQFSWAGRASVSGLEIVGMLHAATQGLTDEVLCGDDEDE